MRKIDEALLHEIQQAAGCSDQDINACPQGANLRMLSDAAVDDRVPEAAVAAIDAEALANLNCQFPRGGEPGARVGRRVPSRHRAILRRGETAPAAARSAGRRPPSCRCRSVPAQHVAAFEDGRYGGRLNFGGDSVTFRAHRTEQRLSQAEFFKLHNETFHKGIAYALAAPADAWRQLGGWPGRTANAGDPTRMRHASLRRSALPLSTKIGRKQQLPSRGAREINRGRSQQCLPSINSRRGGRYRRRISMRRGPKSRRLSHVISS